MTNQAKRLKAVLKLMDLPYSTGRMHVITQKEAGAFGDAVSMVTSITDTQKGFLQANLNDVRFQDLGGLIIIRHFG